MSRTARMKEKMRKSRFKGKRVSVQIKEVTLNVREVPRS